MELKEYQRKTLSQLRAYLTALDTERGKKAQIDALGIGIPYDVPARAWEAIGKPKQHNYISRKNGLGADVPSVCLKVPTGGGKTFLATMAVELVNLIYRRERTGFVLWIVPSTEIYRQTLHALRNREHYYRQTLDRASGGRTLILEKMDRFSPQQVQEYLVVMLLMLPSANRQNKETLKLFQDSTGFEEFFPSEDKAPDHAALLVRIPNLDAFGKASQQAGRLVKTSLGNTLRLLQPLVIIDEGHKAYSEGAQDTIRSFNPCFVLELSATPSSGSNVLVTVSGQDLNREEMIKLDLNIITKASLDWRDTMLASFEQVALLTIKAREYQSNSGRYIRPIGLIQVERTGKDQQNTHFIHANDARDFLINQCGVSPTQVAIKSSENDGLENIDLLSPDCPIQYIITKQALQEGWDCSFAYVLTILTNAGSNTGVTQLVGRILRQPDARKTGVLELDESYVFCFRRRTREVLDAIQRAFNDEGLGDLADHVRPRDPGVDSVEEVRYQAKFRGFEGKIFLPRFMIQEAHGYRDVSYVMDILRRVDWNKVDLSELSMVALGSMAGREDERTRVGYQDATHGIIGVHTNRASEVVLGIDKVFVTQQIADIVPNPWVAYNIVTQALAHFLSRYDEQQVAADLILIVEQLKKRLVAQRDKLAEQIFRELLETKQLCFFMQAITDYALPSTIRIRTGAPRLTRYNNAPVQKSLFEYVPEEEFNETEKAVAIALDTQQQLLFWYRNMVHRDYYYIQGWAPGRVYPDFITTREAADDSATYDKVYVLETKGLHLKGNADTTYKENIFALCNDLGRATDWAEICQEFGQQQFEFQVIYEDEWESKINGLFA